jgi:predicted ATPase
MPAKTVVKKKVKKTSAVEEGAARSSASTTPTFAKPMKKTSKNNALISPTGRKNTSIASTPPSIQQLDEGDWDTDREEEDGESEVIHKKKVVKMKTSVESSSPVKKKKVTAVKKTSVTQKEVSSNVPPSQVLQEEDWGTDSDEPENQGTETSLLSQRPKMGKKQQSLLSPSKFEPEEDWDSDSDDDAEEASDKLSPLPTKKKIAATVGVVAAAGVAVADVPESDDDEKDNASYESYGSESDDDDDSYETDSDGENDHPLDPSSSSTDVQKQLAMAPPFSPMPQHLKFQQQALIQHHLLRTNSVPFCGRKQELKTLGEIVERVTKVGDDATMDNPPEVVLVSGSALGVGTSTFIKEAFYGNNSTTGVFNKCITCRGICEANAGLSRQPLHAISDLLSDLVVKLLLPGRFGGKALWKPRIQEALGGEGPLLATLVPKLGALMDLPGYGPLRQFKAPTSGPTSSPPTKEKGIVPRKNLKENEKPSPPSDVKVAQALPPNPRVQAITNWTWNTPQRFQRLCLAVRDMIQAVAEYHPLVIILDNIQALDEDSWSLVHTLLKSPTLKNMLFVGIHDEDTQGDKPHSHVSGDPFPPIWQFEQALLLPYKMRLERLEAEKESKAEGKHCSDDDEDEPFYSDIPIMPTLTKIHLTTFSLDETMELIDRILRDDDGNEVVDTKIQELATLVYHWTGGNALHALQGLRLLNDLDLLTFDHKESGWVWDQKTIKTQISKWKKNNDKAVADVDGVVTARIESLPRKVRFVVIATSALQQSHFSSRQLYRVLKAAYPKNSAGKVPAKKKLAADEFPINSAKELESVIGKACLKGLLKRLTKDTWFAFSHDIVRECAYMMIPKVAKGFAANSTNPAARKDWQIHCRLGTEFSALAVLTDLSNEERDRCKFLAADQLIICKDIMKDSRNDIAKLLLEAAELCVMRSAFASATIYLDTGLGLLEPKEQFTKSNFATCARIYLWLAKLRLACGNLAGANDACDVLMKNATTLKDKVPVFHIQLQILLVQGERQEALEQALSFLEEMGEKFPKKGVLEAIDRELEQLRNTVRKKQNAELLRPKRVTDKKTVDVMELLGNALEICRLSHRRSMQELFTIRMMNLSLRNGFTRQYPMAFANFSVSLVQRGIKKGDSEMVKEGHRMGQVCERMARLGDFYGGQSIALFHCQVSHWKRIYSRTLEPVLAVYNAQLDAGDFFHVDFSIFTYINLHLASGYSLDKLDDNLQLFDGLYKDYNIANTWKIHLPQLFVSNMLAESENPLIFFGDTLEEQEEHIDELEEAGETEALEYLNFLRLYMAIFFNDMAMADDCLSKLPAEVEGAWIPWVIFFQAFVAISKLATKKGPGKKKLLESIEELLEQLVVWYNDFSAPNPNSMISLLEAELMMAQNVGKKEFPAIKIQKAFEEAIKAARTDELKHIEAFCCERAALHFEAASLEGYTAEYMRKAHTLYDQWNALAKVIEIEDKYAKLLKISKKRTRPGEGYIRRNDAHFQHGTIGGGHGKIRPVNVKKAVKKGARNTRRQITKLFVGKSPLNGSASPTKVSPTKSCQTAPVSPSHSRVAHSPARRLPPPLPSPLRSAKKQRPAQVRKSCDEDGEPDASSPKSLIRSPSKLLKSPKFGTPKIKLPFGSKKTKKDKQKKKDVIEDDEGE